MQPYVYFWLRANGTPYYVGKGTGRRAFINTQHSVHRPPDRARIIVQEYETETEAFEAEAFFVSFFGRLDDGSGCLRNHTVGGMGGSRGTKPYQRTEHHRQQLRDRMKAGGAAKAGHVGGRKKGCKHSSAERIVRSAAIRKAWARKRALASSR